MREGMKRGKKDKTPKRTSIKHQNGPSRSNVVSAAIKGAAQQEEPDERQLWPQFYCGFVLNTAAVRAAIIGAAQEEELEEIQL